MFILLKKELLLLIFGFWRLQMKYKIPGYVICAGLRRDMNYEAVSYKIGIGSVLVLDVF